MHDEAQSLEEFFRWSVPVSLHAAGRQKRRTPILDEAGQQSDTAIVVVTQGGGGLIGSPSLVYPP